MSVDKLISELEKYRGTDLHISLVLPNDGPVELQDVIKSGSSLFIRGWMPEDPKDHPEVRALYFE